MQERCQLHGSLRAAVVGAGPGGLATAARLKEQGCTVGVHDHDPERIRAVQDAGLVVELEGDLGERSATLDAASTDLHVIAEGAELFVLAVPAFAQVEVVRTLLGHLLPGTTLLLLSGAAGTLVAARILAEAGVTPDDVLLGETATQPQSSRLTGPARVRVRFPAAMRAAAFPARNTPTLVERIDHLLPLTPTRHALDPALNNPNFLIHPAPMVLNYGDVERTGGTLSIMNEGMTPGVLRALDAVDAEKMALQRALDLEVLTIDEFYTRQGSGPSVYRSQGEPFNLRDRIWDRYLTEDIPYGTVLYSALGGVLGVPTPLSDAINVVASRIAETDFVGKGRTARALGIDGMDRDALLRYLHDGTSSSTSR